jgi:hypothetical protein
VVADRVVAADSGGESMSANGSVWLGAAVLLVCGCVAKEEPAAQATVGTGIASVGGGSTEGSEGGGGEAQSAEADDDGDGDGGTMAASATGSDGDGGNLPKFDVAGGSGGPDDMGCPSAPDEDSDGDGWTGNAGDCNDCDPLVNPAAIEVVVDEPNMMGRIPEPADEDCDGIADNPPQPCDGGYAINDGDPYSAAAAIGLCKVAQGPMDWGVVSAAYVRADGVAAGGANLQFGIQNGFGPNVAVREGTQMLVLSSGHARLPGQVGSCDALSCYGTGVGTAPAGFPQDVPGCPGATNINDDIALEVTLRAPSNANGYSFNFDFYSFEYPEWVCTSFNDQFIALVAPPPVGSINGNVSFDSMSNPVSVNIAFFEVCAGCPLGTGELVSTGFDVWDDAGATSWLETTAPIGPMEQFTVRFAIWDTGDAAWDSTVLIDDFRWIADGGTVDVGTEPEG